MISPEVLKHGIYELHGDTLIVRLANRKHKRPVQFDVASIVSTQNLDALEKAITFLYVPYSGTLVLKREPE